MTEKKHIYVVEGARGMAAFYILFHHAIFLINKGAYFSQNVILRLIHDFSAGFTGHILMMFFLLSGFSVHYANYGRINSLNKGQLGQYFYKRTRRIYPIYLLAVFLSLAAIVVLAGIQPEGVWLFPNTRELFGALFFFSDLPSRTGTWIATLSTNGPLWSLSYEVLYYILYPAFAVICARGGIRSAIYVAATISALAVLIAMVFGPSQISNMVSLYILWCIGAFLAELKREGRFYKIRPVYVFCVLCFWAQSLSVLSSLFLWRVPMGFNLYVGLFIFFVMLGGLVDWRSDVWGRFDQIIGMIFAIACAALMLAIGVFYKSTSNYTFLFVRVVIVLCIGIAWLLTSPGQVFVWIKRCLSWWHDAGAYSYGLYILQFPILIIAYTAASKYVGSALWGVFAVIPVVWFAKLVELKFQPMAVKYLDLLRLNGLRSRARVGSATVD